jgi:hypothetical protein
VQPPPAAYTDYEIRRPQTFQMDGLGREEIGTTAVVSP